MARNGTSARELYELKQKAKEYYKENGVPEKMEEILNSMFFDNPRDVFGHLSNYFEAFASKPTINKVKGREVLDSKGQPTLQTDVFCTVKNDEKLVGTSVLSNENFQPEHARTEDKDAEDEQRQAFVTAALEHINGTFTAALSGLDPTKQEEGDQIIFNIIDGLVKEEEERLAKEREELGEPAEGEGGAASPSPRVESSQGRAAKAKSPKGKGKAAAVVVIPDEPREKFYPGCNALCSVSQALLQAGAAIADVPLYQHVAQLLFSEAPESLRIPLPMVTILGGGKASVGKMNCVKEFMLVPKPGMPASESVKHIMKIYNHVVKTISAKAGDCEASSKYVNEVGAVCPAIDRPEQGLDMLQEAITHAGLAPGQDFYIALNCAGHEIFDYEKGKYEVVAGQQKDADGLAEFWAELLSRYPSIIAIIDPMRKQEKEGWMRLCERVSGRCYVVGENVYHRPGKLKDEELTEDFKTSAISLKLEQMNTITDILQVAKKMQDADNQIVMTASLGDSTDATLADMAVGINSQFIKVGAPCRGERTAKLNRLLQIESELEGCGKLGQWTEFSFPTIRMPSPPPEEEGEGTASEDGRKDSAKTKK